MRRIVEITPIRAVKSQAAKQGRRLFGPKLQDLIGYIARKYAIDETQTRELIHDVFQYVACEVMKGRGHFTIPSFGRFKRAVFNGGWEGMTIKRNGIGQHGRATRYEDQEDPEWVDEEDL